MRYLRALLRYAAIAALATGALLVAVAILLPRTVTVTRETRVEAPPEKVFPYLHSLQRMAAWSPLAPRDTAMEVRYSGPEAGPGNRMTWRNAAGAFPSGSQEIVASAPDERVETALDVRGLGMASTWVVVEPDGRGSSVIWGLQADMGRSAFARYRGLFLRSAAASELEQGLAALKALVEAPPPAPAPEAQVLAAGDRG